MTEKGPAHVINALIANVVETYLKRACAAMFFLKKKLVRLSTFVCVGVVGMEAKTLAIMCSRAGSSFAGKCYNLMPWNNLSFMRNTYMYMYYSTLFLKDQI